MAPSRLSLTQLPDDILSLIASEVTARHHLAALCLTCRKFNELTTPKLYKDIVLDIGTKDDSTITQMLSPRNPGLAGIRSVVIKSKHGDCQFQHSQVQFAVGTLLQALPPNSLQYFRWRPWRPLSVKNVQLLYKTQKKMTEMELLPVPEELKEDVPHPPPDVVKHARELNLFVGSAPALEQAHQFVKHAADDLDILMIQCYFSEASQESSNADDPLHDTPEHSGRTLRTIFRHKLGAENKDPIKTRTLHLQEVPVHQAPTWFRVIDTSFLTKLILLKCNGAAKALGELCRLGTANLRLKELDITHCENTEGGDVRGTIETILNVVSGLETLEVELCCSTALIQPSSICHQASTLKRLEVFCTKEHGSEGRFEGALQYSPSDVGSIARGMEKLEELLIPYVECDIIDPLDEGKLGEMFDAMTGPQTVLKNLRTVQFYTFPAKKEAFESLSPHLFDHLLGAHAAKLFEAQGEDKETRRLPKLWFVSWGARTAEEPEKHSTMFVKGTRSPMLGQLGLAAIPVNLEWIDNNAETGVLSTMDIGR